MIETLRDKVIKVLQSIYDPEITKVSIWELGLIYELTINDDNSVFVKMTLTAPACPAADIIIEEVDTKIREVEAVKDVVVELVWEPAWTPERLSEAARLELDMFG